MRSLLYFFNIFLVLIVPLLVSSCDQKADDLKEKVNVYFNHLVDTTMAEPNKAQGTVALDEKLINRITKARYSIDFCFYDIERQNIVDALISAFNRGIVVRVITDNDNIDNPAVQDLIDAGIPIIAIMAVNFGLYAQKKEITQGESKIKLELVWEKEIPEGFGDFVFLDENGYNIFSVQCKDPERALREKRILMIQDGKLKFFEDNEMKFVKEIVLRGENITISKNGRNIATIEGLERDPSGKGGFVDKTAILRLYNWKGEELASTQISPRGWEYIDLYPLGNDRAVVIGMSGGEGLYYGVKIFVKKDGSLTEVFSNTEVSWFVDCAENGERVLLALENKEMALFSGLGEEECRYVCPRPFRGGYLSPKGNYIVEHTAGEYLMIYDHKGNLIKEQHARCRFVAFSSDERYLCVTPGPWRVYFFETKTGKMLWEYVDTLSWYRSIAVAPDGKYSFLSSTVFHPTSGTLQEMADKSLVVFNQVGQLLNKTFTAAVKTPEELEFYRWESIAPPIMITSDGQYLMVRLPNRLLLYHVVKTGGER